MAIQVFLAMTGSEMAHLEDIPENTAWLGCHFSLAGAGLSNLPPALAPGSLLVIDDANPIGEHDPELVVRQIREISEQMACAGVLLDFQRKGQEKAARMAKAIAGALACPVAVSAQYAAGLDCPVFLPPLSPSMPLKKALLPWKGRPCWLELALDGEVITVTETGAQVSSMITLPEQGFCDEDLHCHYSLELTDKQAKWSLWRTKEDVLHLLPEADALGITCAVGLWQEWNGFP